MDKELFNNPLNSSENLQRASIFHQVNPDGDINDFSASDFISNEIPKSQHTHEIPAKDFEFK
jgi:hypothetical protein